MTTADAPPDLLPPEEALHRLLDASDEFAAANVRADRGGPFGASVHIFNHRTGELIDIGGARANAVLSTGVASAHAEDQALTPDIVDELKEKLKGMDKNDVSVVMISSAESCPACHAKEEIVARRLVADGLLAPGRFFVIYGATYQDSKVVAGFNDEPYHLDMQKAPPERMIRVHEQPRGGLPHDVAQVFNSVKGEAVAAVALKDGAVIIGLDDSPRDVRLTAEAAAIRKACRYQKMNGAETPWDLGGATLYTMTREIGPLAYAEAQWANVTDWTVVRETRRHRGIAPPEADVPNSQLFRAVAAKPYNQPDAAVTVIQLTPYANVAQQVWRDKLAAAADPGKLLYNGIK